jgi:hypothetical protein
MPPARAPAAGAPRRQTKNAVRGSLSTTNEQGRYRHLSEAGLAAFRGPIANREITPGMLVRFVIGRRSAPHGTTHIPCAGGTAVAEPGEKETHPPHGTKLFASFAREEQICHCKLDADSSVDLIHPGFKCSRGWTGKALAKLTQRDHKRVICFFRVEGLG